MHLATYFFLMIIMENVVFKNSLGNETIEVLGFKTIDDLEKELDLLTKDVELE